MTRGRALATVLTCLLSVSVFGATLHVPAEHPTIQAAIDTAADGDTVLVGPGEYVITEPITFRGKEIAVRGEAGADATTIRVGEDPTDPERASVVIFENGETSAAVLQGFKLTGSLEVLLPSPEMYCGGGVCCLGDASPTLANCTISENRGNSGGGVYCGANASPTLANCTISGNQGNSGGGVYCDANSSPTLTSCTISGNSAWHTGGVCCVGNSSPTLTNCTISGNSARSSVGGGLFCEADTSPTLTNCTISGNLGKYGGGVCCVGNSSPTLTNCTISGNSAEYSAGGVYCGDDTSPTLTNCRISANTASRSNGGGVYCHDNASPTLSGCTISGNAAQSSSGGGGVFCGGGASPTLTDSTISANTASRGNGGGVCCEDQASPTLRNCTVSGNWARSGASGVYYEDAGSPTLTNCIVWGNMGKAIGGAGAPVVTYSCIESADPWPGPGNIDIDPQFCGWPSTEVWVDASRPSPGTGTQEDPYTDLRFALDGYSLSLEQGSPCIGSSEGGENMGAATGTCDTVGPSHCIVHVGSGTYPMLGLELTRLVSIRGAGQEDTVLEGTVYGLRTDEVLSGVTITKGEEGGIVVAAGEAPEIRDCTLSGNSAWSGGGVYCAEDASPTLTNCTISGNSSRESGGGVYCEGDGSPTLTSCTILGNRAESGGGGVYCEGDGSPTLTNCTISGNSARESGGGLYCKAKTSPSLTRCTISGNQAETGGGGVCCEGDGSPTLTDCAISGNTSQFVGGGVFCVDNASPKLIDCTISGNSARESGGGVCCEGDGSPTLTDCAISGNTSQFVGGGVSCVDNASPKLTTCTISGNGAESVGGGVYCADNTSPTLANCTISGNWTKSVAGGVYCGDDGSPNLSNCTISGNWAESGAGGVYCEDKGSPNLANCIVWGNTDEAIRGTGTPIVTHSCIESAELWPGPGNINSDPQFCGWPSTEVWVDASHADPGDGTQANPYSKLASALSRYWVSLQQGSPCLGSGEGGKDMGAETGSCDAVGSGHCIVHAASGTYPIHGLALTQHVSIKGAGQEDTIIEGTVYGLRTGAVLAGVTVTKGDRGGIVLGPGEAPEIHDCTISGNSAGPSHGGGVYCGANASPTLTNCTISGNSAESGAGGFYCGANATPTLANCTITSNGVGFGDGADGVYCGGKSSPKLTNCRISGISRWSAGISVYCYNASPTLINCTIARDGMDPGGSVYCGGMSSPTLTNCIVWAKFIAGSAIATTRGSTPVVTYSCIAGDPIWPGEGNINSDPLFVSAHWEECASAGEPGCSAYEWDPDTGKETAWQRWVPLDYHLQPDSPCIDAGTSKGAPGIDIEGYGRPCDNGIDMGAYETGKCAAATERFARGDANHDGIVNIADVVFTLEFLFSHGSSPTCIDAADSTDDGKINIADAVAVLGHLFSGTGPLPEPFGECGIDLTIDELGCESYPPCN